LNCRRRTGDLSLRLVLALFSVSIICAPTMHASSSSPSCKVSPGSDWGTHPPEDFLEISSVSGSDVIENLERIADDSVGSGLEPLVRGFSSEWSDGTWSGFPSVSILNDSATAVRMTLVPGYRYTFCIQFSSDVGSSASDVRGDVYLMTGQNYGFYSNEYEFRGMDDQIDLSFIPVEWRDMATWVTFRDSHAYESSNYVEFSVAIDSSGSAWSSLGLASSNYQDFHLVLDGWDNGKEGDAVAYGGLINVEILVDVEERTTLPKFIAYLLIGALPLSCIIVPIILHAKYHSTAMDKEGEMREVPLLSEGG